MIRQGLQAEGITVSIATVCRWFGVPRRSVYYKPVKSPPKVDPKFVTPIKAMIEESPSFGYRTVAHLLGFNKNAVQRVFQLMGWQVRKRPIGLRPRIQALPSVANLFQMAGWRSERLGDEPARNGDFSPESPRESKTDA
ncbi:integrase core domain protein [Achromobacter xylosoxidans A8]|uniref:Integrase core domain protein n=2 Tax=Alcaligenes xylosoxydans xylosoxydans TaxID=85698 RepID=E3HIA8_ACHXA|nr:integrase core domain protein [Achromobacter xylosoxidans A8]